MSSPLWRAVIDAVRAGDDGTDALQVYADWLQSQGHPHGELIALGCAIVAAGDDADTVARLRIEHIERLVALEQQLFGHPLYDVHGLGFRMRCGFLDHLYVDIDHHEPPFVSALAAHHGAALVRDIGLGRSSRDGDGHPPTRAYFDAWQSCEHIRTVSLTNLDLAESDLQRLAEFAGLQQLYLHRCTMAPDERSPGWLAGLDQMSELGLWCDDIPLSVTAALPNLPRLRELYLYIPRSAPSAAFEHVLALPALDSLTLSVRRATPGQLLEPDDGLANLAAHDRLELSIEGQEIPSETYARLAAIPSLKSLDLWSLDFTQALAYALTPATELESLAIKFCDDGEIEAFAVLPALPRLKTLEVMENSWMVGRAFDYLERVPDLQELVITNCDPFERAQIERVASLRGLRSLELTDCEGLRPGDLKPLGTLSELRSLDLSIIPDIDAEDLHFIRELPNLDSLELWYLPIDQGLIDAIASCRGLQSLSLHSKLLEEDWLPALTELPLLSYLSLGGVDISDNMRDRLQAAMPGCRMSVAPYQPDESA